MIRNCEWCGKSIVSRNRQARFCSSKCRVYEHRASKKPPLYPAEMTSRERWVRWDYAMRNHRLTKVPFTTAGDVASSTDPATWSRFADVSASTVGVGFGFVLGEGIGCLDLDHCLIAGVPNEAAAAFLTKYQGHYIEVSPSGDGLHIWGLREPMPGTKRTINGLDIETYSTGRYITVTGRVFQRGQLLAL